MKYKYVPNCRIIDYNHCKEMFRFDSKGEFQTDDPKLIKWIRENKNFLKPVEEKPVPEGKAYKCKKCSFETDNVGILMVHYKADHPKE